MPPLRTQNFQKLHVFLHGYSLEFLTPVHVTSTDIHVSAVDWYCHSPALVNMDVPGPTWNSGSRMRVVTNTMKPYPQVSKWRPELCLLETGPKDLLGAHHRPEH